MIVGTLLGIVFAVISGSLWSRSNRTELEPAIRLIFKVLSIALAVVSVYYLVPVILGLTMFMFIMLAIAVVAGLVIWFTAL